MPSTAHPLQPMFKKLFFALTFCAIITSSFLISTTAQQNSTNYKMPFRSSEIWQSGQMQGVHTDSLGMAFDIFPKAGSSNDILAPSSGTLTRGCTISNQTYLDLDAGNGDKFRFVHMDAGTVPVGNGQQIQVQQGQFLGKIFSGNGIYTGGGCFFVSSAPHLHFSFTSRMCPLTIDGQTFSCDNLHDCSDDGLVQQCNEDNLRSEFRSSNNAINAPSAPTLQSNCSDLKNRSWNVGQRDDSVAQLQKCLTSEGIYAWPEGITGFFGNYTNQIFNNWKNGGSPAQQQQPQSSPNIIQSNQNTSIIDGIIRIFIGGATANKGQETPPSQNTGVVRIRVL